MKSSVETLEGNQVKLVVEVEEADFEKELEASFSRLSKEVRIPGFRQGKAPRKALEARIGGQYAREDALKHGLSTYYSEAVKEHEVDVIASPEIDIVAGQESGPVKFDAVVEVRPTIEVSGYDNLQVEIPAVEVSDEDVDKAVDRVRENFADLEKVDRPAKDGDRVLIDISAECNSEPVPGMTADDYLYTVGSGTVLPEIDEQLDAAEAGADIEFETAHPDEEETEPLKVSITVKEVQETVLPEPTDEWTEKNTEFDTFKELRDSYEAKLVSNKMQAAITARREGIAEALAELVDDDLVPESLVAAEVENRVQDMAMRLQAQGLNFEQFMQMTGQNQQEMLDGLKENGRLSAKVDLALRAIAQQESIIVTDSDIDNEIETAAAEVDRPIEDIKAEFADGGHLPAVRSDLTKSKTLDWLEERVVLLDEEGKRIRSEDLKLSESED